MVVLDSSVIIAVFRKNELLHKKALEIIQSVEKIVLLDFVLAEILTVIKLKEGFQQAVKISHYLKNNEDVFIKTLNQQELLQTIDFFENNDNKLSFIDTALLIFSKSQNIKLLTFDKHLQKSLEKNNFN